MFIFGITALGALCIVLGFIKDDIVFLILRGISGICKHIYRFAIYQAYLPVWYHVGAALTIPSSLTLLVNMFPEPAEQARACRCLSRLEPSAYVYLSCVGAIGLFGGCACLGNGE